MPLPLIWGVVAGLIAAGGAVAVYCSENSASSSRGSEANGDEEMLRQQAEKDRRYQQARIKRVHDKSYQLITTELLALGESLQLTESQLVAFGEATWASPQKTGKQLMSKLTELSVGSYPSRMQIAHLLAQIEPKEASLPVIDNALRELLLRRERLDVLRKLEVQLRSGIGLNELNENSTSMIPDI